MRLNEVKKEEQEVLETQSIPLRNYLMKHVMPTLSQGLVECTKVRPDDPVDFLVCTFTMGFIFRSTTLFVLFKVRAAVFYRI